MSTMALLRPLTTTAKRLGFELVALSGAVAYIMLSNALPESGGRVLAAIVLLMIVAAIGYRLVRVLRDPVGTLKRQSKK
ncbi:hypothetical protein [Sphingomonas sp. 3-13AW]|uniref:hypothetical protein n=1 Tax=Sphingomonas sp. 3-13AW TaxID=3050450 RepID=UPI003BB7F0C7